jgi:hypothetical protein
MASPTTVRRVKSSPTTKLTTPTSARRGPKIDSRRLRVVQWKDHASQGQNESSSRTENKCFCYLNNPADLHSPYGPLDIAMKAIRATLHLQPYGRNHWRGQTLVYDPHSPLDRDRGVRRRARRQILGGGLDHREHSAACAGHKLGRGTEEMSCMSNRKFRELSFGLRGNSSWMTSNSSLDREGRIADNSSTARLKE